MFSKVMSHCENITLCVNSGSETNDIFFGVDNEKHTSTFPNSVLVSAEQQTMYRYLKQTDQASFHLDHKVRQFYSDVTTLDCRRAAARVRGPSL